MEEKRSFTAHIVAALLLLLLACLYVTSYFFATLRTEEAGDLKARAFASHDIAKFYYPLAASEAMLLRKRVYAFYWHKEENSYLTAYECRHLTDSSPGDGDVESLP